MNENETETENFIKMVSHMLRAECVNSVSEILFEHFISHLAIILDNFSTLLKEGKNKLVCFA
jgi:hypothetical protein